MLPLLQEAAAATHGGTHPLAGTVAQWLWLVPILPLLGFVINNNTATESLTGRWTTHNKPVAPHGNDRLTQFELYPAFFACSEFLCSEQAQACYGFTRPHEKLHLIVVFDR